MYLLRGRLSCKLSVRKDFDALRGRRYPNLSDIAFGRALPLEMEDIERFVLLGRLEKRRAFLFISEN